MNQNIFTVKSLDLIQKAQELAFNNKHPQLDTVHLLKSIVENDEDVTPFLLERMGVNKFKFFGAVEDKFLALPKTSAEQVPPASPAISQAIMKAQSLIKDTGDEYVSVEHLLLALLSVNDAMSKAMKDSGINEKSLKAAIEALRKGEKITDPNAESKLNALEKYANNLNKLANQGKLDPVIGRDEEIRRVLHILSRRTKNNPILVGEPGVGKTAIAEGIAFRFVNGDVPENLKNKTIYALDMGSLMAGTKFRGEFEERLKGLVKEVKESAGNIILFIDEIHTLIGAGSTGDGSMDAANILKPALARGELRAVGATTLDEYQKYFEKDKALVRRFQIVTIDQPDIEDSISILRGLKERYENHHKVKIRDEAIISAVKLSDRYITERFLPDKAIDLIDEAAARIRLQIDSLPEELDELERKIKQLEIEREAIKQENEKSPQLDGINKEIGGLNEKRTEWRARWEREKSLLEKIQSFKKESENLKLQAEQFERQGDYGKVAEIRYGKIKELEKSIEATEQELLTINPDKRVLREEVVSEDIAEIVSKWTGIPVSKMMESERQKLLRLEDELHKRVKGQEQAVVAVSDAIRRSRAGLQDPKKPIGSFLFLGTTGVGKTELSKALADYLFDDENAIVRIDMSEYQEKHTVARLIGAPPGYVGYDEGGQLTEAVRRKPYCVVLLDEIEKAHPDVFNILLQVLDEGRLTDNKGRTANFRNAVIIMTSNVGSDIIQRNFTAVDLENIDAITETTRIEVIERLKMVVRPEFFNRIDEVIMFRPLLKKQIRDIVYLQMEQYEKLLKENNIKVELTERAVNWLAEIGYEPQFGARPLKRLIQKEIINELAKKILNNDVRRDEVIEIDEQAGKLLFRNLRMKNVVLN